MLKKDKTKENNKITEVKEYQIFSNDSEFSLKIETDNKYIHFSVLQLNIILNYNFSNKYELSQIVNLLNLVHTKYTTFPKLLKFIDKAYSKNKISIEQNSNDELSIIFEIPVDYEEGKFSLKLKRRNLEDKELLSILMQHINRLNNNNNIVKNKFNEIEKQINRISYKNTNEYRRGSEESDINEEINIIKQQLNDINVKLSGNKFINENNNTRNNNSAKKSSISKMTDNLYNNTYKGQQMRKSGFFEPEDRNLFYENNKEKKIYDNIRYNEEENYRDENPETNLNYNKRISQERKNGKEHEPKNFLKTRKRSQEEHENLKNSRKYQKNESLKEDKKYENSKRINKKKSDFSNDQLDSNENNIITVNNSNSKNINDENPINNNIKLTYKKNNINQVSKKNNSNKEYELKRKSLKEKINENENKKEIRKSITYVPKNPDEIEDYTNKKNYTYNSSPIEFKYKMDICNTNTSCGWNDMFEIYISYQNNKEYLASPNKNDFNINIISIIENKLVKSLEGHNNRIRTIRYFIKEYDNKNGNENKIIYEYLISADDNRIVIIWDILNNFEIKQKIDTFYEDDIYSCLISFDENNINNYIITSTYSTSNDISNSATKIYSLESGEYLFYIKESNYDNIYYLLLWYNKQSKVNYLIQFSYKKILINSLEPDNNELYAKLVHEPENEHYSGFIFSKDDSEFLCTSCYNGFIHVWNLYTKKIIFVIETKLILCHIIQWNEKYAIAANFENKSFIVVDLEEKKIYNDINQEHTMEVKCVKKLLHPKFGECLLSAGRDNIIKLWKI